MKVLVPVNTDVLKSNAVMAAILQRAWPVDTTFHLLDVIENQNGGPLEQRVKALSGLMRALEQRLPDSVVFIEVMKAGTGDSVKARAEELHADLILTAGKELSCASC